MVKQFDYSSSYVAINMGKGQFIVEKLPPMIQSSMVNVIHSMDINHDGKVDIVSGVTNLILFLSWCDLMQVWVMY